MTFIKGCSEHSHVKWKLIRQETEDVNWCVVCDEQEHPGHFYKWWQESFRDYTQWVMEPGSLITHAQKPVFQFQCHFFIVCLLLHHSILNDFTWPPARVSGVSSMSTDWGLRSTHCLWSMILIFGMFGNQRGNFYGDPDIRGNFYGDPRGNFYGDPYVRGNFYGDPDVRWGPWYKEGTLTGDPDVRRELWRGPWPEPSMLALCPP